MAVEYLPKTVCSRTDLPCECRRAPIPDVGVLLGRLSAVPSTLDVRRRRGALAGQQLGDEIRPTTAPTGGERSLPTPSRRWHFSGRAAASLRKLPFANQAEKSMPRDCGRSRLVRPGQHGRADERLLLQAANWRSRPRLCENCSLTSDLGHGSDSTLELGFSAIQCVRWADMRVLAVLGEQYTRIGHNKALTRLPSSSPSSFWQCRAR